MSTSRANTDSHICQRCHQPLILDPSIASLTPAQYSSIVSALPAPSSPSDLPPSAKLASLPPSSQAAARIWAEANHLPSPGGASGGGASAGPSNYRSVAESFILLSDSTVIPPSSNHQNSLGSGSGSGNAPASATPIPPHTQHLAAQLHSILSSKTDISHPLCTECTTLLTNEFQKKAEELGRERDAYIAFEQGIQRNREKIRSRRSSVTNRGDKRDGLGEDDIEGTDAEWEELMKKRKELEEEEEKLKWVLEERERELDEVKKEEERVKAEEEEVEREENEYLLSHSSLSTHLAHLKSSLSTAQTHLLLSRSLLSHLESTNVYNDAFQIGNVPLVPNSGGISVGTINGLRLGGRPVVEWEEINAAWGLVALCLDRVADKVGCVFETYKIVPLGSFSRIEELPPSKGSYELYASSDLSPARLLQNRRFNHAMVAVLDCLRQLIEFGKREGKGWAKGNIEIHKDKISNHSIRLPGISSMPLTLPSMSIMGLGASTTTSSSTNATGSGGRDKNGTSSGDTTAEEGWTCACKAVLQVLKRVLSGRE
ncbi:hypothetical protein CI109_102274 [Kwoniella shandongensis]|uniref:Uncharacterized protein n=1 Tax=Kwoniella shandongensis TaxID=1734106 RepID=A0A5M6C415_9TREE|nr:uncharacterized protein CI109_003572 [Kwoniella shandongensis]KAA5527919.1 hypothetical protein CI109_003572 [Kwoniella shandongensis]